VDEKRDARTLLSLLYTSVLSWTVVGSYRVKHIKNSVARVTGIVRIEARAARACMVNRPGLC